MTKTGNRKITLLGDSAVGKTSLLVRIIRDEYEENPSSTIGATYSIKTIKVNDVTLSFNVWDTAGQERFRSLAPIYFRDADIVFLLYSVDNLDSFNSIESWNEQMVQNHAIPLLKVLVANKIDLPREINSEMGKNAAEKINAEYYEVSSKTGEGVSDLLEGVAQQFLEIAKANKIPLTKDIDDEQHKGETDKDCC